MSKRVRTAVFPVAGLGTRFLPATKAMPKEMLTVVDRPLIQYAVDEAREAGIEHFVFITGRNKGVIEDHFDKQFELEHTLEERGKSWALDGLHRDLPQAGQTVFTRQQEPLGLGHAVLCAREIVGNQPFALLLPDMIFKGEVHQMKELMTRSVEVGMQTFDKALFDLYQANVISYEDALRFADSHNDLRLKIKLEPGGRQPKGFGEKTDMHVV